MSKRGTGWIVWDVPNQRFVCHRCNQSHPIALPIPLDLMVDFMKAFVKHHKSCKERLVEEVKQQ